MRHPIDLPEGTTTRQPGAAWLGWSRWVEEFGAGRDDTECLEPLTGDTPIRLAAWILPAPQDRDDREAALTGRLAHRVQRSRQHWPPAPEGV